MFKIDKDEDLAEGRTSIRLSPAFLIHGEDKDHYELRRKVVAVTNEGGKISRKETEQSMLLAVYRKAGRGDKIDMRTHDPVTNQPLDLILVWRPDAEAQQ